MTIQIQKLAVHVLGLERSYKQLHVLRGVDFDIAPGARRAASSPCSARM